MERDQYRAIGSRLRAIREGRGNTQEDIARLLGISRKAYGMYENGQRRIDLNDLKRIADHYGVSLTYFLGEDIETNRIQAELRRASEALEETRKRLEEVVPYSGEWVWTDHFFVGDTGNPVCTSVIQHSFRHYSKKSGVKVRPHMLRHTFATRWLRKKDPLSLQRILGHTKLDMVNRYVHMVFEDLAEAHRIASPVDNMRL